MTAWVERWGDVIAAEPEVSGVWKRRDGGFHIRGRATDPRTGKLREVNRALPKCKTATKAAAELSVALDELRASSKPQAAEGVRFATYAAELFARKVAKDEIRSAAGREKWGWVLKRHLVPAFGEWFLDRITKREIEAWLVSMAGEKYAPATINTALAVLKTILAAASADYDGLENASEKVDPVSTEQHETYTEEEPNSLAPEDVMRFLDGMRTADNGKWKEHWAMTVLGMFTGWRPSELRPLRRRGPHADINWQTGDLIARRSHTVGDETMAGTKNLKRKTVRLPTEVMDVLRWHVTWMDESNAKRAIRSPDNAAAMAASDLLFPALPNGRNHGGGFRSRSSLKAAFASVGEAIGLPHKVTPRALRRSFQDLCREAGVPDATARAICGHKLPAMTVRYSTVRAHEHEEAMGRIIELASARRARSETPPGSPPERSALPARATNTDDKRAEGKAL